MNLDRCPDLGKAFPSSGNAGITYHLQGCATCRAEWDKMEALASLARSLPVAELPPDRSATVRDAMLAAAANRARQPRSRWADSLGSTRVRAALALAASLFVIAIVSLWPPATDRGATPYRARVVAGASARFTHQALPDETIRLVDGSVSLDVEHLAEGERLRVITGDAEVEVRGTSFVVEAVGDKLAWVHVSKGRVEVRAAGHAPVVLGALDHWRPAAPVALPSATPAEIAAAMLTPVPAPKVRASVTIAAVATPPIPLPLDMETPYRAAWDAFRRGDLDAAANGFETVAHASKDGPLASDAAYWRAVALGRAGRSPEAMKALREYLRRFPEAPQAGEASAMLGWLLVDAGDPDAARRSFEQAIRSGSEAATTSGAEGLDALDHPQKASR